MNKFITHIDSDAGVEDGPSVFNCVPGPVYVSGEVPTEDRNKDLEFHLRTSAMLLGQLNQSINLQLQYS